MSLQSRLKNEKMARINQIVAQMLEQLHLEKRLGAVFMHIDAMVVGDD